MSTRIRIVGPMLLVVWGVASCNIGAPSGLGILNRLDSLPDTNGNGFPEIPPPEGIEDAATDTIALRIVNSITYRDAKRLAGVSIPQFVENLVDVSAKIAINLHYGNGIDDTLTGKLAIGPFDLAAEAACPESLEVNIRIVADIPIVGERTVSRFGSFSFTQGTGAQSFECGRQISLESSIGDNGDPVVTALVNET